MNSLRQFWEVIFLFHICFYGLGVLAASENILCYLNTRATSRPGNFRFAMDDIDPNLCTHLVYSRFDLDMEKKQIREDSSLFILDNWNKTFVELKAKNPLLKVLIFLQSKPTIWETTHLELMESTSHVDDVVRNVVAFLRQYSFDGITLEFYPSNTNKVGFMNLIKGMKNAFLPFGYILAVPGSPYENDINEGYDIPSLNRDVEFLILNAYNFHTPEKEPKRADHHSPLYQRPWDMQNYTVDLAVSHWVRKGFPPGKILLGILLGSNSWTLSSDDTTPPAPAKGLGPPAIYTDQSGFLSYFEICDAVKNKGWQVFQDQEKRMGPFAVSTGGENRVWVGYDDPAMAIIKSEYILSKGLGGAAVWDVSMDDFRGRCGGELYPMLTAIRKTLFPWLVKIDDLLFRQKVAFVFSLIVSSCSFLAIIYMIYLLYRISRVDYKLDFAYDEIYMTIEDCNEMNSSQQMCHRTLANVNCYSEGL